jgi:hypothetical protein
MRIRRTADFDRAYAAAAEAVQRSFDQRVHFLAENFRHPSLRSKAATRPRLLPSQPHPRLALLLPAPGRRGRGVLDAEAPQEGRLMCGPSSRVRLPRHRAQVRVAIATKIGCHTFRGTGITAYLENGGTLEHAQQSCPPKVPCRRWIAAHESPQTTKVYDRTTDQVSLDEIEPVST